MLELSQVLGGISGFGGLALGLLLLYHRGPVRSVPVALASSVLGISAMLADGGVLQWFLALVPVPLSAVAVVRQAGKVRAAPVRAAPPQAVGPGSVYERAYPDASDHSGYQRHPSTGPQVQAYPQGTFQAAPGYGYPAAPGYGYPAAQGYGHPADQTPPVPGRDPRTPLPHDGLFMRRSTAYGTRSALGITDLIDSGVMVDQEHIRFDDFFASRADHVPEPAAGEALAVSHGIAPAPDGSKAREQSSHFVEIALRAGASPEPATPAKAPLPVNFVFVVDTSGSMSGHKLDTVRSALQEIYERLRPADSLGIVTFATDVSTLLHATRKEDLPPERFAALVAGMTAGGGTDINLGLQYGIAEIGRHAAGGRTVNRLYLFSDGDPTSGETNWITIRKNAADRMRGNLTLSCFGFGSDARMTELSALAGTARGHSTFVTRAEQVRTGLLEDLGRRDHLAAIDIQVRIDVHPAVTVWHLYGHDLVTDPRARTQVVREAEQAARLAREEYGTDPLPDLITEEKGIRIFAPDLAFGETYWVVLEVCAPDGWDPGAEVARATVQYVDTVARASRSHAFALADGGALAEETVVVHAVGLRTSEITFLALDDLYENDRPAAERRLTEHVEVLRKIHRVYPADEFVADRITMEKLKSLAGGLGSRLALTDGPAGPGGPPAPGAVRAMNHFGRVRSGFTAF